MVGLGSAVRAGQRVLVLVRDLHVRLLTEDGDLTLDPTRNYRPKTKT
jgi:hypothetical protein